MTKFPCPQCGKVLRSRASLGGHTAHAHPTYDGAIPDALDIPPMPGDWHDRGACRGEPTDLWFADRGQTHIAARAKAICATCDVVDECRRYAVDNCIPFGIWGGLSPRQRRRIRTDALRMLGNAVVPQQAALALKALGAAS